MKFPRKRLISVAVLTVGIGFMSVLMMGAIEEAKPSDKLIMRIKLEHSKNILEGLALENFEQIKTEGESLKLLSEMSEWKKYENPYYERLSGDFRTAVDRMIGAADKKNLDGATLGFNQLLMSCVDCHKLLRSGDLKTASR